MEGSMLSQGGFIITNPIGRRLGKEMEKSDCRSFLMKQGEVLALLNRRVGTQKAAASPWGTRQHHRRSGKRSQTAHALRSKSRLKMKGTSRFETSFKQAMRTKCPVLGQQGVPGILREVFQGNVTWTISQTRQDSS